MQKGKNKVGRPKKAPTIKPSLRIDKETWCKFMAKYPGQSNRMFKEWVQQKIKQNMITDKALQELGLESYVNGYYNINEDITVDVEGNIRIENDCTTRSIWIAAVYDIEELKVLIKCINRYL